MEVKNKIIDAIKTAVQSLIDEGVFKANGELPEVALEVPPKKEFGDFATNFAMQSAKVFRTNPRKIAEEIITLKRRFFGKSGNCRRRFYEFLSQVRRNLYRAEKYLRR